MMTYEDELDKLKREVNRVEDRLDEEIASIAVDVTSIEEDVRFLKDHLIQLNKSVKNTQNGLITLQDIVHRLCDLIDQISK